MFEQMTQSIVGSQFPKIVVPLIERAKLSIKIVVFDWRWYPNDPGSSVQLFNQALVRASRRGVKIEAVTQVVAIQRFLLDNGIKAKQFVSKGLVHAKIMIIDDTHVILGSHNYTQHAFTMNQEISTLMLDCVEVQQYLDFFRSLWI
jgi:phosphatidylserine/phosphatidylglycerophosphate/cardiolipin synthase-like enzyme